MGWAGPEGAGGRGRAGAVVTSTSEWDVKGSGSPAAAPGTREGQGLLHMLQSGPALEAPAFLPRPCSEQRSAHTVKSWEPCPRLRGFAVLGKRATHFSGTARLPVPRGKGLRADISSTALSPGHRGAQLGSLCAHRARLRAVPRAGCKRCRVPPGRCLGLLRALGTPPLCPPWCPWPAPAAVPLSLFFISLFQTTAARSVPLPAGFEPPRERPLRKITQSTSRAENTAQGAASGTWARNSYRTRLTQKGRKQHTERWKMNRKRSKQVH